MNRMTCMLVWGLAGFAAFSPGIVHAESEFHGRISFADESGLIKGQEDADWSYAAINSLVMPGDTIWADDNSALEMEFSGGTFVRLADGSRLDVLDVPPNGLFRGDLGSFYVQRVSRSNGDVIFDSPVGSISVEPDTQVRIDILEGGATTVSVRWGRALVHSAESAPIAVNAGMRTFIDPGYLPSEPVSFDRSEEDSFDTWNRERGRYLAQGSTPAPVDYGQSAPLGVSELGSYGEWVYVDNSPYWRPTVVVNYVPYRYGYWSYIPRHGYVWCDSYPFAYVTTHYGYWRHHPRHGWIWRYAGYYRPAYAYTVSYGDYFVWAPLGYDGYPCYSSAYAGFTIGGVHFSFGWSSYAYRYDVFHSRPSVYSVNYTFIYDSHHRHRYHDHHYWRIEADERPYRDAGRPHWPGDNPRTYRPDQVYRGVTLARDSGRAAAPERARQLEERRTDRIARVQEPRVRPTRSTPVDRGQRSATVRDARVANPSVDRIARNADRIAPEAPASRTRTFTNDNAREAGPLSRGSSGERPTSPAERRTIGNPSDRRGEDTRGPSTPSVRSPEPVSRSTSVARPERSGGPGERSQRLDGPAPRSVTSPRAPVERPSVDSTRRPEVVRPENGRTQPERPSVSEPRPSPAPRTPLVTPQRPTTTRPELSSPEVVRPRTTTTQRPAAPRPEVSSPQVNRPQPAQQRVTIERPSPSRQEFAQPYRAPASSRQEFSQPSRPSIPQAPSREYSAPQQSSSPRQQYSVPSRPSAPAPSYSAPQRSGGSSFQSPPGGSNRGDVGGPTRSAPSGSSRGGGRGNG